MSRSIVSILIMLFLGVGSLLGCGGDDVTQPDALNVVPTVIIEEVQSEEVEEVAKVYDSNGNLLGTKENGRRGKKIKWRLKASPAPETDLVIKTNWKAPPSMPHLPYSNFVMIAKFQNYSETFHDTIFEPLRIFPLPTVQIVGEGLAVDLEELDLPERTRGGHRIPEGFVPLMYQVGEQSAVLCEGCISVIFTEAKPEFSSSPWLTSPPPGSTISTKQRFIVWVPFDTTSVTVNGIRAAGSLNKWVVHLVLPEGSVNLHIEWTLRDGSTDSIIAGPYIVRDE